MSFPGYLKSLSLVSKNSHDSEAPYQPEEEGEIMSQGQTSPSVSRGNDSKTKGELRMSLQTENIIDERGNTPSKSLWVGNIPSRTTSSELRALFNKFGAIVSTKPMARYAFVNFETIECAIAAFKEYHDQDIFDTQCSTINIRFTGSQAEAKQAKDEFWERKTSISTKAQATQKQYFHTINPVGENGSEHSPVQWPNGKPPTGPKSQRSDTLGPLRKGDCYRPGELSRGDSHRSGSDYRKSEAEEHLRGRSFVRRSDQHYSPMYSPGGSRSSTESRHSYASAEGYQFRNLESPLPWEREEIKPKFCISKRTHEPPSLNMDGDALYQPSVSTTIEVNLPRGQTQEPGTRADSNDHARGAQRNASSRTSQSGMSRSVASAHSLPKAADNSCIELGEAALNSLEPNPDPKQLSKSPSIHPMEKLRASGDHFRGSSVLSEVPTSSTGTSTKRKRCYDCKRSASDLSPLVPCSKCSKRFHSGCGEPKPSSCPDKSMFVCGRCQRNQVVGTPFLNAASRLRPHTKSDGKTYLVSPPLSLSYDGSGSADLSPRNDQSHESEKSGGLASFFLDRLKDEQVTSVSALNRSIYKSLDELDSVTADAPTSTHIKAQHSTPKLVITPKQVNENLLKSRYKRVTCKWWLSGTCTQPEDGCYYAHSHTDVSFPDRKRANKSWTCYDWLNGRCALPEPHCLHAHKDTRLHVWKDGRPSFKHVTCFWWSRGKCKWSEESCKFAHQDTGLYSLDPSDVWQGGSRFSTVNPREERVRKSQPTHSTDVSASSRNGSPLQNLHPSDSTKGRSIGSNHSQEAASNQAIKPSLTINTSTDVLLIRHRASPNTGLVSNIDSAAQTSSDHNSNKIRFSESSSATVGHDWHLPTPCTEETAGTEHNVLDGFNSFSSKVTSIVSENAKCQVSSAKMEISSTDDTQHDSSPKPQRDEQHRQHDFTRTETSVKQNNILSRDPRRQRQSQASDLPHLINMSNDNLASAKSVEAPQAQSVVEQSSEARPVSSDDNAYPSVKRCLRCPKQVFGTEVCRVCSNEKDVSFTEKLTSQPKESSTAVIVIDDDKGVGGADPAPDEAANQLSKLPPLTIVKNSLKRSSNDSNLFLKNKRPKTSMMFSPSGGVRPDALKRRTLEAHAPIGIPRREARREPILSLKDLLIEERAKNSRRQSSLMLENVTMQSLASSVEKEAEAPNVSSKQTSIQHSASIDLPVSEKVASRDLGSTSHVTSNTDPVGGLQRMSSRPQSGQVRPSTVLNESLAPRIQTPEVSQSPQRPVREARHWRDSDSPEPLSHRLEATKTNPVASVQQPRSMSPVQNEANSSPKDLPATSRYQDLLLRENAIRPEQISWATPITCTRCQKNHKKCLHDNDGSLSAVRCRDYVLLRKGRPDAGRSRYEWDAIVEASELEPNSDEGSLQEESESGSTLGPSDVSEDDFATALGGDDDEMIDNDIEDRPTFQERSRRPQQAEQLSPKLKSPTAVTKFFIRDEHDNVVMDRGLVTSKAGRNRIMFESESEDDECLSDEDVVPVSVDRPYDPLRVPLKESRNLYEVAPELNHQTLLNDMELRANRQPRPSRKQQWAELRDRQLQERREKFGNPHWQVDRRHSDVMVTALIERIVPPKDAMIDTFESVQKKEETVPFCAFLGMPKLPEICLMNDGERLGFRDDQRERDRTFGRTGRGLGRRDTDDEKWPVRTK